MELLAPAGTKENFMAALGAGADAIYLGGKVFNARANAGNFTIDELTEAVKTAHILGTAIYVTVNMILMVAAIAIIVAYPILKRKYVSFLANRISYHLPCLLCRQRFGVLATRI